MSKRVLIIEDSPTEALRARLILEQAGYQVSLASDGREGLTQAIDRRPDLIVLDTIMPRMSGYEAYQRLRINPATVDIPILMLLTETEPTDAPCRIGRSTDTYIAKPYAPDLLLAGAGEACRANGKHSGQVKPPERLHGPDIGWVTLQDGCIVSVDQSAEKLLGRNAGDLAGTPFADYFDGQGAMFAETVSRAHAGRSGQGDFDVRLNGTGEVRRWHISASAATCDGQAATQLALVDVTEWMRLEERIQRSQTELEQARQEAQDAQQVRTDFLANMSHELRTPLYGFMGTLDLVLDTELTPEQRTYLDTAKNSANLLLAIISDILEFSEIEAGEVELEQEDFDVWATVAQTVEMMTPRAQERGLAFSYQISPQVPRILMGDARRLRQVLTSLIDNAIRFTEQGEVTIQAEVEAGQSGRPASAGDPNASGEELVLHFLVRDTGAGIPDDAREVIFQPFRQADDSATRQYGGTGLKLHLSRQLVETMGGRLWVDSEIGKGSTFHFTLTLQRPTETTQPSAQAPTLAVHPEDSATAGVQADGANPSALRILLAEDSPTNQLIAVANLKKAGHTVQVANNGVEAVQALIEGEADFDLVLMDVAMPEMDGLAATRAIREHEQDSGNHIPVIAMTAFATKEYRERCQKAGMDGYVSKPVRPDELHRAIAPFLSRQQCPPTAAEPESDASSDLPVRLDAALEIVDGDIDLLQAVVEMSLEECPEYVELLGQALTHQDAAGVESAAHRLKGILGNIGGLTARDVAQRLETMGEEGNLEGGTSALEELEAEMRRVAAFFANPGWAEGHPVCDQACEAHAYEAHDGGS